MEHLLIAYDILVIIIGFSALSNAVVWALRTGKGDFDNFSIVYGLYTLTVVILVLRKYLFVNVKVPIWRARAAGTGSAKNIQT